MYSFKLDIGSWENPILGTGYVLANPILDGVVIKKTRDQNYNTISRKEIDSPLTFTGDEYDVIKTFYDSGESYIDIKCYYNDSERVEGQLLLLGSYDTDKKHCYLEFRVIDQYSEFMKNQDIEINIKNIPTTSAKTRVYPVYYEITLPCTSKFIDDAMDFYLPNGLEDPNIGRDPNWAYFTYKETKPCVGGFKYVFYTYYFWFAVTGKYPSDLWANTRWLSLNDSPASVTFPAFIKLFDVLERMLETVDEDINISESTYCDYFNIDNTNYQYIQLADKSDVKRPGASNPAEYENLSMKTLLEYLQKMLNVTVQIDESDNFKLIHDETYSLPSFITYPKHDLTSLQNCTANQNRFTTIIDNKVNKETWGFESSDYTFQNITVDYGTYEKANADNILEEINNNIIYLKFDPDDANDSGLAFVACEKSGSTYYITNFPAGVGDPYDIVNGYFSPEVLFNQNFKDYNRPYAKAYIVELDEDITTVKEKDRKCDYSVPVKDIDDIDFSYLVKADIGNVIPHSLEIDMTLKTFAKFSGVY